MPDMLASMYFKTDEPMTGRLFRFHPDMMYSWNNTLCSSHKVFYGCGKVQIWTMPNIWCFQHTQNPSTFSLIRSSFTTQLHTNPCKHNVNVSINDLQLILGKLEIWSNTSFFNFQSNLHLIQICVHLLADIYFWLMQILIRLITSV